MSENKSYRQMIKDRPGEYKEEKRERFVDEVIKQFSFEELACMEKLNLEQMKRNVCVGCGKEFPSDDSNEVPVCLHCLTGVSPEAREARS